MLAPLRKMFRAITSPVTFSREAYNFLWDTLEAHNKAIRELDLTVQYPLFLTKDSTGGSVLRANIEAGGPTPCLLVVDGGSSGGYNGTGWTTCNYTYSVYATSDTSHTNKLFSMVPIDPYSNQRIAGISYLPAAGGFYTSSGGTTYIFLCGERPSSVFCTGQATSGSGSG